MSRVADALRLGRPDASTGEAFTSHEHPWGAGLASSDIDRAPAGPPEAGGAAPPGAGHGERLRDLLKEPVRVHDSARLDAVSPLASLRPAIRQQIAAIVERVFCTAASNDGPRIIAFGGVDADAQAGWIAAAVSDMLAHRTTGRIAAVDLNLTNPALHEWFGIRRSPGVLDAMRVDTPLAEMAVQVRRNLWALPTGDAAGPGDTPAAFRARVARLAGTFDHVVVSLEPLASWCGGGLPAGADGLVLAIAADATRRQTARQVAERLHASGAVILGAVLTNRRYAIPEAIYRRL